MKKLVLVGLACYLTVGIARPALAIKPFAERFKEIYATDKADKQFVELVNEAKCNVCHVEKEDKKKVRNVYGKAMHEILEKDNFPIADYKKDPAKFAKRLEDLMKKLEEEPSGDEKHKTFGDRIKANLLPGGDKNGK
jgi:hypothetical protein